MLWVLSDLCRFIRILIFVPTCILHAAFNNISKFSPTGEHLKMDLCSSAIQEAFHDYRYGTIKF